MSRSQENRGGKAGATHRVQRVERQVRDVVGTLLLGGLSAELPALVSVSRVMMSSDLRTARVQVVAMSSIAAPVPTLEEEKNVADDKAYRKAIEAERKVIVKTLNESAYEVQAALAKILQMRFTPKVTFFYDEGFDNAMKVDGILRKLGSSPSASPALKSEDDGDQ